MKRTTFIIERSPHRLHTLTASLNMERDLVFDDEEVYSTGGGTGDCEVDDRLRVRVAYKSRVLNLLVQAFNGISDTCGEAADERLFCILERLAQSGRWKALDEIEVWLMNRGIPFTKQRTVIK
jgi:hypothetical protein